MVKLSPRKNPHPKKVLPLMYDESDSDGTASVEGLPLKENLQVAPSSDDTNTAEDEIAPHPSNVTASRSGEGSVTAVSNQGPKDKQQITEKLRDKTDVDGNLSKPVEHSSKKVNCGKKPKDFPTSTETITTEKSVQKDPKLLEGGCRENKKGGKATKMATPKKREVKSKIEKATPKKTLKKAPKAQTKSKVLKTEAVVKSSNSKCKSKSARKKCTPESKKSKDVHLGQSVSSLNSKKKQAVLCSEKKQKETLVEEDATVPPNDSNNSSSDDLPHEDAGDIFKGRTTDELLVAESMLMINTRELTETLSALNTDSAGLCTPLHNSVMEKRIRSFRTPSKTPVKRTNRLFLTPDRLTEKSIRSASISGKTPSKSPSVRTPVRNRVNLTSSPKSIMKDKTSGVTKTPSPQQDPQQKSPAQVHFAELPAKHRSTGVARTQKLREADEKKDTKSQGKRKRVSDENSAQKKRKLSAPSPSKNKVKRRLNLDMSVSDSDAAEEDNDEENTDLNLVLQNSYSDSDGGNDSDSCHSECGNALKIIEEELPLDKVLNDTLSHSKFDLDLNAFNVKSLLRNIITNEAVMDMVRNTIKEEGIGEQLKEAIFEPKMTRSRVKQVIETNGQVPGWPISPMKTPVKQTVPPFINMTFSDEEEDEDYDPAKDNESGDDESVVSSQASEPQSPVDLMSLDFSALDASTNALVSEEEFGANESLQEDLEMIALRTRSKVPLTNTSVYDLEKNFAAPDITADMYDTYCDDQEWQHFLCSLNKEELNETFEDDNDPEYNVMEELEKEVDDKENYRDDRGVRVSKKEVNLLIDELMEAFGEDEIEEHVMTPVAEKKKDKVRFAVERKEEEKAMKKKDPPEPTSAEVKSVLKEVQKLSDPLPLSADTKVPMFSFSERRQLEIQMRKHVQLLAQTKILSTSTSEFKQFGRIAKELTQELRKLGEGSKIVEGCVSAFHPANLKLAEELLNWKHPPPDHDMIGKIHSAMRSIFRNTAFNVTLQCPTWEQMDIFLNHRAFMYAQLLPDSNFVPSHKLRNSKNFFLNSEDSLVAMGLEQFEHVCAHLLGKAELIHEFLVPIHPPDKIMKRINQMQLPRAADNPIKMFRKESKLPKWPRYTELQSESQIVAPKDQDPQHLPKWFKGVVRVAKKQVEKDKENAQQKIWREYLKQVDSEVPKSVTKKKKKTSVPILGLKGGTKNFENKNGDKQPIQTSKQNKTNSKSDANSRNDLPPVSEQMETAAVAQTTVPSLTGPSAATLPGTPKAQTVKRLVTSTPVHSPGLLTMLSTPSHNPGLATVSIPLMNSPQTPVATSVSGTPLVLPGTPLSQNPVMPGTPVVLQLASTCSSAVKSNPVTPRLCISESPVCPEFSAAIAAEPMTPDTPNTVIDANDTTIEIVMDSDNPNSAIVSTTESFTAASGTPIVTTAIAAGSTNVSAVNTIPLSISTTAGVSLIPQSQVNQPILLVVPPGAPGAAPNFQDQQFVWIPAGPNQHPVPQFPVQEMPQKSTVQKKSNTGKSKKNKSPVAGSTEPSDNAKSHDASAKESSEEVEKNTGTEASTDEPLPDLPDMTAITQQFLGSSDLTGDVEKKSAKKSSVSKVKPVKRGKATKAKKQLCLEKTAEDKGSGEDPTNDNKSSPPQDSPPNNPGTSAEQSEDKPKEAAAFTVLSIPDERNNDGKDAEGKSDGKSSLSSDIIRSAFLLAQGDCGSIEDLLGSSPDSAPKMVKLVASPMKVRRDTDAMSVTAPQENTSNLVDQFLNADTTQVMSMFSSSKLSEGDNQPLLSLPDLEFSQFTILMSPSRMPHTSISTSLSGATSLAAPVDVQSSSVSVSTVQSSSMKMTASASAESSSSDTRSSQTSTSTVDSILRPIPVFAMSSSSAKPGRGLGDFSHLSLPFSPNKSGATTFSKTPASRAMQMSMITSTLEKIETSPMPPARPIPKFVGFLSPVKGGPLCAPEGDTMNVSLCLEAPDTSDVGTHHVSPVKKSDILCTPAKVVVDDDDECSSSYWSGMSNASTPTSLHAADTPEKLPDTPTKNAVQIMQSMVRGIVTPPKSHSKRLPPKTPSPQKFMSGLSTPEKALYSPNRLRPLIPKPTADTPTKPLSPYVKKIKKSPRRKILQQHVRSILPKGFVHNAALMSPTKITADNLKAKAKKVSQKKHNANVLTASTRKILPNLSKIAQDAGMATADEDDDDIDTVETSEYDTLDSEVMSDDQEKQPEKAAEDKPVKQRKKRYRKRIVTKQDEDSFSDGDVDSQEEGDDHISQLMKASSTIRFDPGEQARKTKKKARSKACREATKQMLAPNLVQNDPLRDERDMSCAQDYLDRVREALKGDEYVEFLRILQGITKEEKAPVKMYEELGVILADHPVLMEEFGIFLSVEDAQQCGTFKVNDEYNKIKHFLRKIEVFYRRKPGHFQKIIKAFTPFRGKPLDPMEIWKSLQPLLKGQKYLLEEFQELCLGIPAESSMVGFEEITVGSDEELEDAIDEVEEITLYEDVSDTEDGTKKCKCRCHEKDDERYSSRRRHCLECGKKVIIKGEMYLQRGNKYLKPLEITYNDKTKERKRELEIEEEEEDDMDDGDDIIIDDDVDDDDDDQQDDLDDDDDSDDDMDDIDGDDDDDDDDNSPIDDDDLAMSPSPDDEADDADLLPDGHTEVNEAEGTSGENDNWTDEQDLYMLTVCKDMCRDVEPDDIEMQTYRQIAEHLKDKTADEVKSRFEVFLSMLPRHDDSLRSDDQDASAAAAADADAMETD